MLQGPPITFAESVAIAAGIVVFGTLIGMAVKLGRVLQRMDSEAASHNRMQTEIDKLRLRAHDADSKIAGLEMLAMHKPSD